MHPASAGQLQWVFVPAIRHDIAMSGSSRKSMNNMKFKMSRNRVSNDDDQVRRWCVAGNGVVVKSCLDVFADLLSGRLGNLMPEYQARQSELRLIFPSRQSIIPPLRLIRGELK